MRKKLLSCILISVLAFQLWGCGKSNMESTENSGMTGTEDIGTTAENGPSGGEDSESTGEDMFLSFEDLPWKDNSLDAYSAVVNMPLQPTKSEGEQMARLTYILGNSRGSVFKSHNFEEQADCWDEIKTVTDQGVETSFRLAFWEEQIDQARAAGSIAGNDHYMMLKIETVGDTDTDREILYRFFETDENMQVLNSFYVDCLDGKEYEDTQQLQVDAQGNLHMIIARLSDFTYHYYIVAPDGTFLMEVGLPAEQKPVLFFLYDGRVGMQLGEQLQCADIETGNTEILAKIKQSYRGCTLWDEKTLLYADGTGLYRSGLAGENPELLYNWSNHGISASEIETMQVTEGGGISLIYQDYKGANYLKLEPTTEEVEIREITFGVHVSDYDKYLSMVTAFNKQHPAYRIKMKTYGYGDTSLQTELIAGKGPVLVDTAMVGFENNADWWEPLDDVLRQMISGEELIPKVLDTGRINGILYGVVTDFGLNTVVTFAEEPEEWDYDAFLSCFDENDPGIKSVLNGLNGSDGLAFISVFFYHDLNGKYLFDAEDCSTRFDSPEFRKILKLGSLFSEKERRGTSEDLRQGASPCAVAYIDEPGDLACLRIWGRDKLRFIGYPSEEGSGHYIMGSSPITVRANATAEEKRLAYSFLRFLLSYDAQMEAVLDISNYYFDMSVRKDVLDRQINCMNEYTYPVTHGFPQFDLGDQVDNELDGATLYELLEKAEPKQYMPRELATILNEELNDYLSGNLTEERLIEHLENRVGLYLSEQK